MRGTEENRESYGISVIDENLFVIGGIIEDNTTVSGKNESFNYRTKQWELKSPLNIPRR